MEDVDEAFLANLSTKEKKLLLERLKKMEAVGPEPSDGKRDKKNSSKKKHKKEKKKKKRSP